MKIMIPIQNLRIWKQNSEMANLIQFNLCWAIATALAQIRLLYQSTLARLNGISFLF